MVVYEVNLSLNADIVKDYLDWLKPHIVEMMTFGGFVSYQMFKVSDTEYCVQYKVMSEDHLNTYFNTHAKRMREDGINRFGDQFSATRRIMECIDELNPKKM